MSWAYYCLTEACSLYRRDSGKGNGRPPSEQTKGMPPVCSECHERLYYRALPPRLSKLPPVQANEAEP